MKEIVNEYRESLLQSHKSDNTVYADIYSIKFVTISNTFPANNTNMGFYTSFYN